MIQALVVGNTFQGLVVNRNHFVFPDFHKHQLSSWTMYEIQDELIQRIKSELSLSKGYDQFRHYIRNKSGIHVPAGLIFLEWNLEDDINIQRWAMFVPELFEMTKILELT